LGHVLTNQHVVDDCKKVTVGDDTRKQVTANVLETDRRNDLALLKISSMKMASAETRSLIRKLGINLVPLASDGLLRSDVVELGEDVLVAGYPYGEIFSNSIKVTKGIVSANRGLGDDTGQFQIDAAVQPGNSGGPIYDGNGNIVGVVVSQLNKMKFAKEIGSMPENVNFGIKASTVRQFLTASGLTTKWSKRSKGISTKELAKIAKNQTVMVVCHKTPSNSRLIAVPSSVLKVNACDQLAAHPSDPDKKSEGVYFYSIDGPKAVQACRLAVQQFPTELRFGHQLARSLRKVDRYSAETAKLTLELAKKGYPVAMASAVHLYRFGRVIEQDFTKAFNLANEGVELGYVGSIRQLGYLYLNGQGVEKDKSYAFELFKKAAEKGDSYSQSRLGWMYRKGVGVEGDFGEAFSWQKRSADQGYPRAIARLAHLYKKGLGTDRDIEKSLSLGEEAMRLGDPYAPYLLAYMYRNGEGVPEDLDRAIELYKLSQERGFKSATKILDKLCDSGTEYAC
jgi:TPR repeat protein